jgi:hypothetical protein
MAVLVSTDSRFVLLVGCVLVVSFDDHCTYLPVIFATSLLFSNSSIVAFLFHLVPVCDTTNILRPICLLCVLLFSMT